MRNRNAKGILAQGMATKLMKSLSEMLALPVAEQERFGVRHTAKEIGQQPDTWPDTFARIKRVQGELRSFLSRATIHKLPTVFLVGAGTSDYVGRSVAALLRRTWQCDAWPIPSTDLITNYDDLLVSDNCYLWIHFSRSGDSSEGVAVLESALKRRPEIHHLVICCNEAGRMVQVGRSASNVFTIVLDEEVNDKGLAMTSSYSNMVVAGQCLAHIQDLEPYNQKLTSLVTSARSALLKVEQVIPSLVKDHFSKVCFLGTGALFGVAVESALKVTELTAGQIVSFGETFLGVRHGPLSAIDAETLVVGFVSSNQNRRAYELDLLEEIKAKKLGRNILTLTSKLAAEDHERLRNIGETVVLDECIDDLYKPPVSVIVGQLLGLFFSLKTGLRPDAPSPKGAISRVVSKVRTYED